MLTDSLDKFHKDALAEHTAFVHEEIEIETTGEYLYKIGCLPEINGRVSSDSWPTVEDAIGEDGFQIFYRVHPGGDQRIFMAGINPRITTANISWYKDRLNEGARLAATDGDPSLLAEVGASHLPKYLTSSDNHWNTVIEALLDTFSWMDSPENGTVREYVQEERAEANRMGKGPEKVDPTTGFFRDIYYTNLYKFATNSAPAPKKSEFKLAAPLFRDEIERVDPDLIVTGGRHPWDAIRGVDLPAEKRPIIESLNGSPPDGGFGAPWKKAAAYGVFSVHDRIIVVLGHPSRLAFDPTKSAIKVAGEYL